MKNFWKLTAGAALIAGAATIATAAPAAAQPYGYAPRAAVCDPYSRFYDPFVCRTRYNYFGGGPVISFGFGGGWHDGWRGGWDRGHDFRGGHDFHGGGHDSHNGNTGGFHGNSGGHHR